MLDRAALYFEAHVTIEPPTSEVGIALLNATSNLYGFKVSTFAMLPGSAGEVPKAFTSARHSSYSKIAVDLANFVRNLQRMNFAVVRYKIEDTIIDSKREDVLGLLK